MIIFIMSWGLDKRPWMRLFFPLIYFMSKEYLVNHVANLRSKALIDLSCLKVNIALE